MCSSDLFFDGRSVVISLAGLFGGPLPAAVAALLASGYRLAMGGGGALTGVGVIITSAVLGTAYYYLRLNRPRTFNLPGLLGFGFLVHLFMLLWVLTLPGDLAFKALHRITLPVLLILPVGTLLLGLLLRDQEIGRKAATAREESEDRYRQLVESANSYIFTAFLKDGQPVRTVYSPTCLPMTGYTPEELEKDINLWYDMVPEEDRKIIREQFSGLWAGDTPGEFEYRIKRKDGEIRWFSATLSPTYDDSGNLVSYYGLIRDVTERNQVEELLKEHRDHLEETVKARTAELEKRVRQADLLNRGVINLTEDAQMANRKLEATARKLQNANVELEAFAYTAAHDLKAPLRAIEGYIDAVMEDYGDRLEDDGREYAGRITGVCRRMEGLIDDLLSYSRLSQIEIRVKPIELSRLIDQAMGDLERSITEKKARIDIEESLPIVLANRSILLHVVTNLISNAVMFVAPGEVPQIKIGTQIENGKVRLLVEDNGIGIKEEDRERVYHVFERLHGIETYPGTGIGLAIVRRGVEKMGGEVGFESELGKGSTFWIELPEAKRTKDEGTMDK